MSNNKPILQRSKTDRIIAGVCGGLGDYFDIDPVLVRAVFVLLALINGFGLLLYAVLWIVIPEAEGGEVKIDRAEKIKEFVHDAGEGIAGEAKEIVDNMRKKRGWLKEKKNVIALIIVLVGFVALFNQLMPYSFFRGSLIWPIIIIALGFAIIFKGRK